jgi:hypothetical protein
MMMNETPAVVAYPVDQSPTRHSNDTSIMDENVYSSSIGDSKFADDTIEMSGNFFSQVCQRSAPAVSIPLYVIVTFHGHSLSWTP